MTLLLAAAAACFPCVLTLPAAPGLDLEDPTAILRHVVKNLPSRILVVPSENHFYFEFPSDQVMVRGNLWVDVLSRDQGKLPMAYAVYRPGTKRVSKWKEFGPDELLLERESDLLYRLTFERKKVEVALHPLPVQVPANLTLLPGEVYIGPSYDDSGFQFTLLYLSQHNHFLWLLNPDIAPPEPLQPKGKDLLAGRTSGFVFYRDRLEPDADGRRSQRLILVGVAEKETAANSPFDGPFDQLPDNHIQRGEVDLFTSLSKYLENPSAVDQFGRSKDGSGIRVSIMPYIAYEKWSDLSFVSRCKSRYRSDRHGLYACLAGAI